MLSTISDQEDVTKVDNYGEAVERQTVNGRFIIRAHFDRVAPFKAV